MPTSMNALRFANDLLSKGQDRTSHRAVTQLPICAALDRPAGGPPIAPARSRTWITRKCRSIREFTTSRIAVRRSSSGRPLICVAASTALMAGSFDPDKPTKRDLARFREQLMAAPGQCGRDGAARQAAARGVSEVSTRQIVQPTSPHGASNHHASTRHPRSSPPSSPSPRVRAGARRERRSRRSAGKPSSMSRSSSRCST